MPAAKRTKKTIQTQTKNKRIGFPFTDDRCVISGNTAQRPHKDSAAGACPHWAIRRRSASAVNSRGALRYAPLCTQTEHSLLAVFTLLTGAGGVPPLSIRGGRCATLRSALKPNIHYSRSLLY